MMEAYPIVAEHESAAARAHADQRSAQAETLALAAQKLLQAEAAKMEAAEAKTMVHDAGDGWVTSVVAGDEDLAKGLCAFLRTTRAELRECVDFKVDKADLGVDGAKGLAYLFANLMLPRLEVLGLSCNSFGEYGATVLMAGFPTPSPLRHLDLSSNSMRDAGAVAVAHSIARGALPALSKLSLKSNDVGDAGAAALFEGTHSALQWLNLSSNQISDTGASAIASALVSTRFENLHRLSLDHNALGDKGMDALADALDAGVPLQELYVECNPASDDATRRVLAFFGQVDDEPRERAPQDPLRSACEKVSVSIYQNTGCVCQ